MDPWKPVIDQWRAEDATRPRKQRHTARKMYRDLVSIFSADVSEVTVRRYVRSRKQEKARDDYEDTNVSAKVVKLIQSYAKIVNITMWGKHK